MCLKEIEARASILGNTVQVYVWMDGCTYVSMCVCVCMCALLIWRGLANTPVQVHVVVKSVHEEQRVLFRHLLLYQTLVGVQPWRVDSQLVLLGDFPEEEEG